MTPFPRDPVVRVRLYCYLHLTVEKVAGLPRERFYSQKSHPRPRHSTDIPEIGNTKHVYANRRGRNVFSRFFSKGTCASALPMPARRRFSRRKIAKWKNMFTTFRNFHTRYRLFRYRHGGAGDVAIKLQRNTPYKSSGNCDGSRSLRPGVEGAIPLRSRRLLARRHIIPTVHYARQNDRKRVSKIKRSDYRYIELDRTGAAILRLISKRDSETGEIARSSSRDQRDEFTSKTSRGAKACTFIARVCCTSIVCIK